MSFQVFLGITRAGGDNGGSEVLYAIVGTQSTGEEPVAIGNGKGVVASDTIGGQTTCHTFAPYADVFAGIADDGGVAGCS